MDNTICSKGVNLVCTNKIQNLRPNNTSYTEVRLLFEKEGSCEATIQE